MMRINRNKVGGRYQTLILVLGILTFSAMGCKSKSRLQGDLVIDPVIRIGEVGSMTGSDSSFGVSTHRGIALAIEEANANGGVHGKKIELLSVDDEGKASEAVLAATQLISQKRVHGILGEVASTRSIAMASIAQQYQVPMITPSSINSKVTEQGNYVFRVCFVDSFQSKVMAEFAIHHLHAKTAALLKDVKSDYSQDSAKIFKDLFEKAGGRIVAEQTYAAGDIDFRSQLTAIKAARPDVILVPGYYTEIGLMARQKRELGLENTPLLGGDGWDAPQLVEIGGESLAGSYFVSHFSKSNPLPLIQNFVRKYKAAYGGREPDGLAALGYDAALVFIDAVRRVLEDQTQGKKTSIREAIAATQGFQGVTGSISMDAHRNAVKKAVLFRILKDGNLVPENFQLPSEN